MKNKIINILKSDYQITDDLKNRVNQLLECAQDDNVFYNLDQVMVWFDNRLKQLQADVIQVDLKDCDGWSHDKDTGNLKHDSGGYFEVIGVKTNTSIRESGKGWTQPMVDQGTEASIVGLIKKRFNDIPHYLIDAKFEPGNYGKIQFSPTLQCTYDNLNQYHKGNKPLYYEYFENAEKHNILFEHWYPEDGGRFYLKRVKNMIVETYGEQIGCMDGGDKDIKKSDSHVWLTMYQIKQLLKKDNLVNAHLRSIISYL